MQKNNVNVLDKFLSNILKVELSKPVVVLMCLGNIFEVGDLAPPLSIFFAGTPLSI